ncbi:MAG: BTAD domain-containing putative transcriptional regulator [bacterium]
MGAKPWHNRIDWSNWLAVNILKSKLSIPKPLRNAIDRRRLSDSIEEAVEANLILLIAPAGYGKTTMAQQILTRQQNAVKAWYHLDASDADPDRFLKYLVEAMRCMLPKFNIEALGSNCHQMIDDICFAIEQYQGPDVYLVLDNWECVDHNPDIASIPLLLARSGRNRLTIVIASRISPSFKTRREQTLGNILLLDSAQLAFSLPECQEVLRLRYGRDLEDEQVERFWKETSGWCVSVGLLPTTLPQSGFSAVNRTSLSPKQTDAFHNYFIEEVYDTLPPDLARFLCETSLFDELTKERCTAVVSLPVKVEEFLNQLGRMAIPHITLEQRGRYRLHALARQVFRLHLEKTSEPEKFATICRSTADCYLKEGLIFEAIALLMELGDYDKALELMNTKWSELFGQHGWTCVKQWLETLPVKYHNHATFIKTYSNVLNVSGDNKGAIAFLKDKLSPERFSDDIESFGSLWANYWWARINTELGPHYENIKKDHDTLTSFSRGFSPTMLGIFQNTLGMAAHLELRMRDAIAHVKKAAELVEEPYVRLRIIANQNEALYSHILGESITALDVLKKTRDDCHRLSLQSQISKTYMLEANIHLAMGFYREAFSDIDHCLASMREFGHYSLQLDAYIGRFRGMALWYLGDKTEGLRLLMAAREPAKEFNTMTGIEVELLCEYYSLLDDCPNRHINQQEIPSQNHDSECNLIFLALQAIKNHQSKNYLGLRQHATQICDIAQSSEIPQWIATGSFLLAMSLTQSKDKKQQIDLLEKGLNHLRRIGWRSYPMANDIITSFVLAKVIRFGMNNAFIELLLSTGIEMDLTPAFNAELSDSELREEERIRLWEAASRLMIRGLSVPLKRQATTGTERELSAVSTYREFLNHCPLPPLRIELLGGFSVISKGRVVHFNRSSSRLLLQHLLVAYPRKMHEEELIEYLWPETDPGKSRANLRTAAKDLRKALDPYSVPRGLSYVVYADQHYCLELPTNSRIDHLDFTDLIQECIRKEASTSISINDSINDFRQALETYRGTLLPMLPYEPFVIELRERLQALFQKGYLKLAELLMDNKSLEEAAMVVERALEYDQLWTDGVLILLQIHAKRGEILKTMRIYRDYKKRLWDELALPPDESIRDYFDEIIKSSKS